MEFYELQHKIMRYIVNDLGLIVSVKPGPNEKIELEVLNVGLVNISPMCAFPKDKKPSS